MFKKSFSFVFTELGKGYVVVAVAAFKIIHNHHMYTERSK